MFYYPNALPPYAAVEERTEAQKLQDLLTEVDGVIDVFWQEWLGRHRGFAGLWESNEAAQFAVQVINLTALLDKFRAVSDPASEPAESAPTSPSHVG